LSHKMLKLFTKFILFNIAIFILWSFIHTYYETILWFFTIKASQIFGPVSFTNPEIVNGEYVCTLKNITCYLTPISITRGILITIPLLLSSSGISLVNKLKMVMTGLLFLFLFQTSYLLLNLSADFYKNYQFFLQKGAKINQVIVYNPIKVEMIIWLYRFFNNIFKFPVEVGIWIGLVSYYKRSEEQHWVRKLF